MDREADKYELCSHMLQHSQRFVVRARHNRRLAVNEEVEFLRDTLEKAPLTATRDVYLSRREGSTAPRAKSLMLPRLARAATLSVSAAAVTIQRPRNVPESHADCLRVNVVLVRETQPPKGQPAVNWVLLTSEPIDTREQWSESSTFIDAAG